MSSLSVRNAVRGDWDRLLPDLPFYETINYVPRESDEEDGLPDVWGTLQFRADTRVPLTMGSRPWMEERGVVSIAIVVKSGDSDSDAIARATQAMEAWTGWCTPNGRIWFQAVGAPQQLDEESLGEWFIVSIACNYVAQDRAPIPDKSRSYTLTALPGSLRINPP